MGACAMPHSGYCACGDCSAVFSQEWGRLSPSGRAFAWHSDSCVCEFCLRMDIEAERCGPVPARGYQLWVRRARRRGLAR